MKSNEVMKKETGLNDKELCEALRDACIYYLADWELEIFLIKAAEDKLNRCHSKKVRKY